MAKTTDFGFESVPEGEKQKRVDGVFDSVADRYDLMNDLMSGGLHRLWKRFTIAQSHVRPGQRVLDLAGGTGDLARKFSERVGNTGTVCLADVNAAMLRIGRDRLLDAGCIAPAVQCNAEKLPFRADAFDCVSIAFGLRNVTRKDAALAEMRRVVRPGGRVLVLEFSRVWPPLGPLYDAYSFSVLPALGKLVARDAESYRYLAESIRMFPSQAELKLMMETAGFDKVEYFNLTAGLVALHVGVKY
ncbi:MAG TPA: bifunctional demethylmenaquinone methyltransferase/2-methoxy-6-polyprenyl-1,4-benzoquinol methylase UbiE [Burkholderiales bacterium]|nr:bifunctional demethylmenaquinone methyltransferase/2-methoxy-6-polyprenyl-1,4-benzoquinol methylase UbiE [Betaproteobacteria bacterium]HQR51837.1 bifunctional demethylmenaquinone methyltransferase/2-methoxy-6-polyprenyl-1,4-benzoquinol methylase UbiE [Burkholderiales bacterium]